MEVGDGGGQVGEVARLPVIKNYPTFTCNLEDPGATAIFKYHVTSFDSEKFQNF